MCLYYSFYDSSVATLCAELMKQEIGTVIIMVIIIGMKNHRQLS